MKELAKVLRSRAIEEGFDAIGVCQADSIPHAGPDLQAFLRRKYHGQMEWMKHRSHWRGDPKVLWPQARSVIMLAHSYAPQSDPLDCLERRSCGTISVYAQNRDYHDIIKRKLKRLGRWLIDQRSGASIKVFVDTAPVMEKPLAQAAGLGWQGKHTNLVSRKLGNWFFLGAIFTDIRLPADDPGSDHCGSCRRCLDICPTDAFPAPYQLDARRCISYLTIEYRGRVSPEFRKAMGNRIFGCDDCLAVCPWNKFASTARECRYHAREELRSPALASLASLDDAAFRKMFRGGPVRRIGRNRFVRNVLYAIGNSGDAELVPVASALMADSDPVVAEAARWAKAQLKAEVKGSSIP